MPRRKAVKPPPSRLVIAISLDGDPTDPRLTWMTVETADGAEKVALSREAVEGLASMLDTVIE